MSDLISCPSCHAEIEVSEVLRAQLSNQIRAEFSREASVKQREIEAIRAELEKERISVNEAQASLTQKIRAGVDSQRKEIAQEAMRVAKAELAVELQDRETQVTELSSKLKKSQEFELALRERERKLEAEKQELKLAAAREVASQASTIRQEALKQFAEEHQMKDAEHQKMVLDLKKQIDELRRKAEQGSQQSQGEIQEIELERMLEASFPADSIMAVAKGVNGGDAVQRVFCSNGIECGSILWESKRTKAWSKGWLPKLRDDQRAARASCAVIVSETLPEGVDNISFVDGVWICSWSCAKGLAMALRVGLAEASKNKLAAQGRAEKMELVYNYLSGMEFQQCVEGIVEAFVTMQTDLEKEKRSMKTIWKRREKQIERAIGSTAGLYGDLQGIIGASLPVVDGLGLERIATSEASDEKLLVSNVGQ